MTLQEAKALAREMTKVSPATTDQAEALAEWVLAQATLLETLIDRVAAHAGLSDQIVHRQRRTEADVQRDIDAMAELDEGILAAAMQLVDALVGHVAPTGTLGQG